MENFTAIMNISLLIHSEDVLTTAATFNNTLRNATVARNVASIAYEWRFILPLYILIFMLSISGNCMVIATLAGNKTMRTVTNVYLLNLAISDFLLGVFCVPFTLVGQIYRRFLFGPVMCKLIPYLQAVSVSVSVWTLVAISLERYFAICKPLESRKWQTLCHAYKMIAIVWVASFALNSPIPIVSTLLHMRGNAYKCREVWPSLTLERAFNLALDAALLLIPIFLMSFAYTLIMKKLWRGMRHEIQQKSNWQRQMSEKYKDKELIITTPTKSCDNDTELSCKTTEITYKNKKLQPRPANEPMEEIDFRHAVRSTHTDKSISAKRKVIQMLFVIIVEFFVCWTPLHVINTIYVFYPEDLLKYVSSKGIMSFQFLAYCSSFCNPVTYCFMNRKFREAFITLINCKICGFSRDSFPEESGRKQVAPQPSSPDVTACVIRGSHTGRSELDGAAAEECV